MDNKITERETHDLMNVESFSQLPFIRPAPPPIKEKGIRLFGIEFGSSGAATTTTTTDDSESAETTTNNNNINAFEVVETNKGNNNNNNSTTTTTTENNIESNRRFECHYCCRNFPTSQALGGHQNAHKRERQHAKRAHLQSTMVHASTFSSDPHLYHHHHHHPLINYRFASSSSSSPTSPMPSYPTWNSNSSARFYGTHQAASSSTYNSQPINGSPLAFWRIPNGTVQSNPSFSHERSFQNHLPLLASEERVSSQVGLGPSVASQNRYVYDSSKRSDHVSLDLHL